MDEIINVSLDEYQDFVESTWIPAATPMENELRILMGIFGESGELAELVKKFYRDQGDPMEFRDLAEKEIGDILYYLAKIANFYDLTLQDCLNNNVLKLTSRKERNVITGSGDNR